MLTRLIGFFLVILLMGGVLLAANDITLVYSDMLCPGLKLAEVPVGGLSVGEAERLVGQALLRRQSEPLLILQLDDKRWEVPWDIVSSRPQPTALVRRGYGVGRTGSWLERLESQFIAKNGGKSISLGLTPDQGKLRLFITEIAAGQNRQPQDATLTDVHNVIRIENDIVGMEVDVSATLLKVAQAINDGQLATVVLVVKEKIPAVRAVDLQGIEGLVAAFTTTYDVNDEDRSHNIKLAAEKLNGMVIKSGEAVSFNDRVGTRLAETGYRMAPTMASTGIVMDWGGGVCQVSSTFYNAALLADFQVLERSAHYQPPSYVPLGLDATVADGQIDLKLKSNSAYPFYIKSIIDGGKLEVRIYGKREQNEASVRIETVEKEVRAPHTLIVQDPSRPVGDEIIDDEGKPSFAVTVQRVKLQGDRETSRETISTDEFDGAIRVVRVGTRKETNESGK